MSISNDDQSEYTLDDVKSLEKMMDKTRTVTFDHVRIQYAHPDAIRIALEYQDRLYQELIVKKKEESKKRKNSLINRLYTLFIKS